MDGQGKQVAAHPAVAGGGAYRGGGGAMVLAIGAAMAVAGYRLMLAIGRLSTEERVLR